jgi:hypothetical protein
MIHLDDITKQLGPFSCLFFRHGYAGMCLLSHVPERNTADVTSSHKHYTDFMIVIESLRKTKRTNMVFLAFHHQSSN